MYSLVKNPDIKGIFHEKRKMKMVQCSFIFKPTPLISAIEGGVLPEQNFYSDSVAGIQVIINAKFVSLLLFVFIQTDH